MKTLVVHYSKFGHTAQLAVEIATTLGPEAAVITAHEFTYNDLQSVDLFIIGSPTHKMNLPVEIRPLLDDLPGDVMRGKRFAAYDTSYELSRWLQPFTAAKRLDRKLRRFGGTRVLPPETFIVEGREGPLRAGEQERAHDWALAIVRKLPQIAA